MTWTWDYSLKADNKMKDYHYFSINDKKFTSTQLYRHYERQKKSNKGYITKDLSYTFNTSNSFENTIFQRKTWVNELPNKQSITKDFISQFSQLAFIGGDRPHRSYPSGGAQYYVNIHLLFNENRVEKEIWNQGNVTELNADTNQLLIKRHVPWSQIQTTFIQDHLAYTSQFAIVLSVDFQSIFEKYNDISYKLVQQEAGHIGQNIQLVATYLGIEAIPLGGFYDLELNKVIGDREITLYALLLG
ncbi:SagB/ThcOx family dehydrogenase [Virgibacillus sp. MSJ-26]|uniref:SagB/ThcOx family dehydrogenase n=1 Tax=Virgibacillus sp. MSJ-26 TaxID=2841522 RepID=UPI00209DAA02|nr:SagB/ThcOx family dehydrogenase [Virgibacillus sp. MSJ-26]